MRVNVLVKFLAFSQRLPVAFTALTLPDGSRLEDLFTAVEERWGEQLACGENGRDWRKGVMAASNGRMLQAGERLTEGQQITLVGMILGG